MYLFTRSGRLAPGNMAASTNWVMQITEKVNQISELEVSLWTTVFSPGLATVTWVAAVEDLSALEASEAKLNADTGFQLLVEEGARFLSAQGIDDGLAQFLTPTPAPDANGPQPEYASVVRAELLPGGMARGIDLGMRIAARASQVMGSQVAFLLSSTGVYGQIMWVTEFDDVQALQKGNEAVAMDGELISLIDNEGKDVYKPDATQIAYRRMA